MKKYYSFILVLMLCALLCGCVQQVCNSERETEAKEPVTPQEAMIELFRLEHDLQSLPLSDFSVDYLGCYDDVHVGFINGGLNYTMALEDDEIGGFVFHYNDGQKLQACRGNELLELSEAYEAGWFTEEAFAQLHDDYSK